MRNNRATVLKFELMSAADNSEYYVQSRVEIVSILRAIMHKNTLLSVYFDEGNAFIVTSILAVDEARDEIIVDCGPDAQSNARLPRAPRLICVTSLDKVKVQFVCGAAGATQHDRRTAFRLPLPERLLRLQRREYFRLTTPVINPLKCTLKLKTGNDVLPVEFNVADISCGGISTIAGTDAPVVDPATQFECAIPLADGETLRVMVELRNTFEVTMANGRKMRRCGYQFIGLLEKDRALVQRYIMQQQRTQRARTGSLL